MFYFMLGDTLFFYRTLIFVQFLLFLLWFLIFLKTGVLIFLVLLVSLASITGESEVYCNPQWYCLVAFKKNQDSDYKLSTFKKIIKN